jgi:lipoate-protein ligase A
VLGQGVEACALQSARVAGLAAELHLRFRSGEGMSEQHLVDLSELAAEEDNANRIRWDHDQHAVEGFVRTTGGTLHARATFGAGGFDRVAFATDTPFEPPTLLEELQDVLQGMPPALLEGCVGFAMRHARVPQHGWRAADVLNLLRQLAEKHELRGKQCFSTAEVNALMPCPSGVALGTGEILGRASMMLVPYCAKPSWCAWRHKDGCTECGKCEVSDAYRLARERGMKVVSIVNYEHLETTLAAMKADRVPAFVGMCCRHFLIKRHRAFAAAGVPAVLMDIGGANCYELKEERAAYAGEFTAESQVDGALLEKVMKLVPESSSHPS